MKSKIQALFGLLKSDPIKSREELIAAANDTAIVQIRRDALMLQMDTELALIRDRFTGQIEQLNVQEANGVKRIKQWATLHRATDFNGKQELILGGHSLAFRLGTGSVELLDGKEADVVDNIVNAEGEEAAALKEMLVRLKPSLNKEAVLREWRMNSKQVPAAIAAFGIGVAVEESFTFTPARIELPDSASTSAVETSAAA